MALSAEEEEGMAGIMRCAWRSLAAFALGVACVSGCRGNLDSQAPADEPAWKTELRAKLDRPISVDIPGTLSLADAAATLQRASGISIVVDPKLKEHTGYHNVQPQMRNWPVRWVLWALLRRYGLEMELRDGAVFVSDPDSLRSTTRTVIYDVGDLLAMDSDQPAPAMDLLGRRVERKEDEASYRIYPTPSFGGTDRDTLLSLIWSRTGPRNWEPGRGANLSEDRGQLIVTQSEDGHRRVREALAELRREARLSLETRLRFLAVEPGKLNSAGTAGRLLAEAVVSGVDGQRVHSLRGSDRPLSGGGKASFTGALLDCRPLLAADRQSIALAARVALWLPAEADGGRSENVAIYMAPLDLRAELGRPERVPLGALRGKSGKTELVVAELLVRTPEPERLAKAPVEEPEPRWRSELRQALDKEVDIDFRGLPLWECIERLARLTRAPIVVDPKAFGGGEASPHQLITLHLPRVRFGLALRWVLRTAGLDYELRDGVVFVSTPAQALSELVGRTYDVRELTDHLANLPAPGVGEGGLVAAAGESGSALPRTGDRFVPNPLGGHGHVDTLHDRIKRAVLPASWGVGGARIEYRYGLLIVDHLPEAHQLIARLLAEMAQAARPEVRIDAAFYELEPGEGLKTAEQVEAHGRLLSRLATVGDNRQRLHAMGGTAQSAPGGGGVGIRFTGALIDFEPALSYDRWESRFTAQVSAELLWIAEDLSAARMKGSLHLRVGRLELVELGTVGGRRIAAVLRASVRNADQDRLD